MLSPSKNVISFRNTFENVKNPHKKYDKILYTADNHFGCDLNLCKGYLGNKIQQ